MIDRQTIPLISLCLIFMLMAAACQHQPASSTPEMLVTATASRTSRATASATLTPTQNPTNTATPEPTQTRTPTITPTNRWGERGLELTPLAYIQRDIHIQNIDSVQELAIWGTGRANDILLSPDGVLLAVGTNIGVYLYDSLTIELLLFFPTRHAVQSIAFSNENPWIALGESGGIIEIFDYVEIMPMRTLKINQTNLISPYRMSLAFSGDESYITSIIKTDAEIHINRWHTSDWQSAISFSIDRGLADYINIDTDLLGIFSKDALILQSLTHPDESHSIPLTTPVSELLWHQISAYEPEIISSRDGDFILFNTGNAVIPRHISEEKVAYRLDEYPESLPNPCYDAPDTCLNANGGFSWDCRCIPSIPPIELIELSPDNVMVLISQYEGSSEFRRVSDSVLAWEIEEVFIDVTFSPGSEFFFGLKPDGMIEKRGTLDGDLIGSLNRHPSKLYDLAFSPDGSVLAAGFNDGYIRFYSLLDGQMLGVLNGNAQSLTFSPDGSLLAGGLDDGRVRIYELDLGRFYEISPGHMEAVTDLAFSSDGKQLLTASDDCTASLWDLTDRYRKWQFMPDEDNPFRLRDVEMVANTSLKFISGNRNGIFRLEANETLDVWFSSEVGFSDLTVSPNELYLGAAGTQSWLLTNLEPALSINPHPLETDPLSKGVALSFTSDSSVLILATAQDLQFWSAANAGFLKNLPIYAEPAPNSQPVDVETSPDGMLIALGTQDGMIHIFGLPSTSLD